MSAARERLERINQLRLGDGDVDFLFTALRRALDALEMYSGSIGSDATKAMRDIDALAREGTGRP